jgi:hypothetical protein
MRESPHGAERAKAPDAPIRAMLEQKVKEAE